MGSVVCYLNVTKPAPSCLLALGTSQRTRMRILRVDPNKDIPKKTVVMLLNRALDLCRDGTTRVK